MLADWVKETTSTTGTGATITLTGAVASFVRFQDFVPVGATVTVAIKDGNNRELVECTLATSTTLTRTRGISKLESGTPSKNHATFLSLTSSAEVGIALAAEMAGGSASGLGSNTFGNTIAKRVASAAPMLGSTSTFAMSANTLYLSPYRLDAGMTLAALTTYITSGAAGGNLAIGVWAMAVDGSPGTLLGSTTGVSTTSTGIVRGTVSQSNVHLSPGWYWVGLLSDSTPTIAVISGAVMCPIGSHNSDSRLALSRLFASVTYASGLPSPPTSLSTTMSNSGGVLHILLESV